MYIFFDEDGTLKAGTVLSEAGNAKQVELVSGKRTKVKGNRIFFEFTSPSPAQLMTEAQAISQELDPMFLWEVAPEDEFSFEVLAENYWTTPSPQERAALLMHLQANPVYFSRKGRGVYRRAQEDVLHRALEAIERKAKLELERQALTDAMVSGTCPDIIRQEAYNLLIRPDKNGIYWKALQEAASQTRQSPLRLLLSLGAIKSPWTWHVESFYQSEMPKGRGFSKELPEPDVSRVSQLPVADVVAFSIDDSDTTEVDDALSVTPLDALRTRVGIHIACPAFGITRDSPLDMVAKARMSTIYAPGLKTTMLPDNWISAYSLDEGKPVPALSLYVDVNNETFAIEKSETRLEQLTVAKNVRYDKIDHLVTEEALTQGTLTVDFAHELTWLWRFAKKCLSEREAVRGRPEPTGRIDWFFALKGEGEEATIEVKGRRRGAPLDLIVAEMMILANSTWGLWLEEHDTPGIYRSQRMGRVRMSTSPGPHDGLGVIRYAWSTSPLRRFVDLVNQRQMLSVLEGVRPAYASNDTDLFSIVGQFEATYTTYSEFQTRMERYWSLRWIRQEGLTELEAIVVKGDLVRIDRLPFMQRVPGLLEELPRGTKVRLKIHDCDLVDLVMEASVIEVLDECVTSDWDEELMTQEALQSEESAVMETTEDATVGTDTPMDEPTA